MPNTIGPIPYVKGNRERAIEPVNQTLAARQRWPAAIRAFDESIGLGICNCRSGSDRSLLVSRIFPWRHRRRPGRAAPNGLDWPSGKTDSAARRVRHDYKII